MKYKVGDRVRVIKDLYELDPRFPEIGVTEIMEEFKGKIVTIAHVSELEKYWIHEDECDYEWRAGMFQGLAEFELHDLESRMVVKTRSGDRYFVVRENDGFYLMNTNCETHIRILMTYGATYSDDMKHNDPQRDIMKVFKKVDSINRAKTTEKLLWEREEPKKMTLKEIEQKLGYDVEIIQECEVNNEE